MQLFNKNYIGFVEEEYSWKDAIYKACEKLVADKIITTKYIDKIIENTYTYGPYYVLTEDLALPHASLFSEVLKPATSFYIFKNKVDFIYEEKSKKVKYLVVLAANDQDSHLNILKEIINFWNDKNFLNELDSIKSAEQLQKFVEKLN